MEENNNSEAGSATEILDDNELQNGDKTGGEGSEYEAKYNVLKGKYDAEIPRLIERTKMLETMLSKLDTPRENTNNVADATPPEVEMLRKEYPSIYEGVRKLFDNELGKFNRDVENRFETVNQTSSTRAQQQFQSALDARVPGWRVTNDDPDFLNWLRGKDRFSPYTRHQLLLEAYKNYDLETVSDFFIGYADLTKKKVKDNWVAPNTAPRNRASNQDSGGDTYSQKEITKFYNDLALGKIKLTPAELKVKEESFYKAMQEGRVLD